MTEQGPPTGLDEPESESSPAEVYSARQTTGVPAVDRVLADVDGLDALPLEEHLEAFERAHEDLRAALDAPADSEPLRAPVVTTTEHPGEPA
jgi:hypothetical protein